MDGSRNFLWFSFRLTCGKNLIWIKWVAGNVFFQSYDDVMWIKTSITLLWMIALFWIIQWHTEFEMTHSVNYSTNKKRDYSYDVGGLTETRFRENTEKYVEILFPSKILRSRFHRTGRSIYKGQFEWPVYHIDIFIYHFEFDKYI